MHNTYKMNIWLWIEMYKSLREIDSQSLLDSYSMQLSIYRVYLYMAFVYRRLVLCSNNDAKSNHGIQNEKKQQLHATTLWTVIVT